MDPLPGNDRANADAAQRTGALRASQSGIRDEGSGIGDQGLGLALEPAGSPTRDPGLPIRLCRDQRASFRWYSGYNVSAPPRVASIGRPTLSANSFKPA